LEGGDNLGKSKGQLRCFEKVQPYKPSESQRSKATGLRQQFSCRNDRHIAENNTAQLPSIMPDSCVFNKEK
jgi:hypothetical protein